MPDQSSDSLPLYFEGQGLDLAQHVDAQLQLVAPDSPNRPLYREMLFTVLRMAHDDLDRWNAKIMLQAVRE
ncbi:MAG: cytochrome D ubiquinol oxidase subunit II, partial [Pseudomonas sp.]|nr:cytochrome D ubiquinol oxidase subunit II [Pseudomonas sp.]